MIGYFLLAASTLFGPASCFTSFCMKNMYAFIGLYGGFGKYLRFILFSKWIMFVCLFAGIFMNSVDWSNEGSEDDEVDEEEKLETKADNDNSSV